MATGLAEDKTMNCLKCGGSLDGVTAKKCPSCGRPFDPDRPASVTRKRKRLGLSHWVGLVAFVLSLFFLALPWIGFKDDAGMGKQLMAIRKGPVKVLASVTDWSALVVKSGSKRSVKPMAVTLSWLILSGVFGVLSAHAWMGVLGKGAAEKGASSDMV